MDYSSKLLVVISVGSAILLETYLTSRAWPGIWALTLVAFIAAAAVSFASEATSLSPGTS